MGLRVPQSQIVTSKYTSGKEYIFNSTYREYIGYYYELNGKLFAGKEFNTTSPELIRMNSNKVNNLLTHPSTYTYGKISGVKINNTKIISIPFNGEQKTRYFVKKLNVNPILIKEVDKNNFIQVESDPLYQILEVNFKYDLSDEELNVLNEKMPGIKSYLQYDIDNIQTSSDENII
jgi:hypothetical protein